MAKWEEIQRKLVSEREKLFDLEEDYRKKKRKLEAQVQAVEGFHMELNHHLDERYQTIVSDFPRLAGATEEMLEAAKETLRRYHIANDSEFTFQRQRLDDQFEELEKDFKKAYRKQEEKVEAYQRELRDCD